MQMKVDPSSRVPIFEQLVRSVRQRVASGQLKPGDRLPAVRELALQLVVNPNTVQKAYAEMIGAGLIHSRKGLGVFVSEPHSTLSDDERARRVGAAADGLITEALLQGFTRAQIGKMLADRLREFGGKE